jgi:hypothetical protein
VGQVELVDSKRVLKINNYEYKVPVMNTVSFHFSWQKARQPGISFCFVGVS